MKTGIYGAGQYGEVFYKVISKYEKIDFFVDKSKKGKFLNIPIISPEKAKKSKELKIYNSLFFYEEEIRKEVDIVSFIEVLKKYPQIIYEIYKKNILWFGGELLNPKLKEVKKLLKDKISLNFFDKWVKFRETFNMKHYPYPTNLLKDQYFVEEFKYSKRFVDCGTFDGDSVIKYFQYNKNGMCIAFEPDENNIKLCNKNLKNKNVLIYPLGVYSYTTILKFNPLGSGGSIDENGSVEVAVTSLDETIYNFRPDYIKMDIEGAEKEALLGAKKIIKDFSPKLAISIYHKAEDLWEIPLLIKEINPKYEFKIRCHANMCLETILYAKVRND
jgi:FkbM family methyltransferase